ncbi:MAG TPA: YlqD family protein [Bacillota bacterium]|nr:YlqD family protein [Bacillota bacterium]
MERINLIRPVLVKVKVTENYKRTAAAELQDAIRRIERELQHLDFQEKRLTAGMEKENREQISFARQHIERERQRKAENRQKLINRLKDLVQLPLDSEVVYGKMESTVELKIGDDWDSVIGTEIILRDGMVEEIRKGAGKGCFNG